MNKQYVNVPNTREWVRCNEDSRAFSWRQSFIKEHGGEFVHRGRYWAWQDTQESVKETKKEEKSKVASQKQLYIIEQPDGGQVIIDNLSKFCRENKLNKSAMYLVMNGKRNHHKHFKCSKIEE